MLPDHRGPLFKQKKAMLIQNNICDRSGELIPPWQMFDKLRPGTLILVKATLLCWLWNDEKTGRDKKVPSLPLHLPLYESNLTKHRFIIFLLTVSRF
jgi:hypothetical protein